MNRRRLDSEHRAALDTIGGLSVTGRPASRDRRRSHSKPDSKCFTTSDESIPLDLAALDPMPALLVVELDCPGAIRASNVRAPFWRASGQVSTTSFFRSRPAAPDFARSLYSELASGQPLAWAVANARRLAHALCASTERRADPVSAGPAPEPMTATGGHDHVV